ncbi:hypothetical protein GCM10020219_009040 [Nonomuraea dietziae]
MEAEEGNTLQIIQSSNEKTHQAPPTRSKWRPSVMRGALAPTPPSPGPPGTARAAT